MVSSISVICGIFTEFVVTCALVSVATTLAALAIVFSPAACMLSTGIAAITRAVAMNKAPSVLRMDLFSLFFFFTFFASFTVPAISLLLCDLFSHYNKTPVSLLIITGREGQKLISVHCRHTCII